MKKVLHIIDSMGIGGAEKLVASTLFELGMYENHLIILYEPWAELPLPDSVKKTVIGFRNAKDIFKSIRFVKKYIREHNIEVVHAHLYWSIIIARLAAGPRVKLFNTIHAISSEACYKINRLLLYLERFTYKKRHHIIGVSAEVLQDFDKWVGLKGPSSVIYNIIDDSFFTDGPKTSFSLPGRPLKLVATGNLREQKNYPYLLEVFRYLPPDISLDIYGEGHLRERLQAVIEEQKLNIRLCGQVDDLPRRLRNYDFFVMSSLYEGFSLGLMEAMASGLPVFLSDVPVLKEAGGDCAVYFDLKNPKDMAEKLISWRNNTAALVDLSAKGYQRAKTLTSKSVYISRIRELYEGEKS